MITLIAAIDRNRLIGRDNTLPWHIPEDFKHFRETTQGHPIVMGRKTYESLPKRPLPHRRNLIVSSLLTIPDVETFNTVEGAITAALTKSDEVFVIGGQSVYEQTIDMADRLLITHIDAVYEGNYWFPEITDRWSVARVIQEGDGFRIVEYHLRG